MIQKELVEKLKVRHIEANTYGEAHNKHATALSPTAAQLLAGHEPVYSLPLLELDVLVGDQVTVAGVLDPGLQIVVIWHNLAKEVDARINPNHLVEMEGANEATNWTLGCAEYLTMQVGDVPFKIHAHVVKDVPFQLLLGWPFGCAVSSAIEDLPNGETEVSV